MHKPGNTYVVGLFKPWNGVDHPLTQAFGLSMTIFFIELLASA